MAVPLPVTSLPVYSVLEERLKPFLKARIYALYEEKYRKEPSSLFLDHLLTVALVKLKSEIERVHDLQMSAATLSTEIVPIVLKAVQDEMEQETDPQR